MEELMRFMMLRSVHVSVLMFGLVLAGPATAQDLQTAATSPAASIDISALTAHSDFTVFMRKEVPEDVRRAALRKLRVLMELPVSCMELCIEPEPAMSGVAQAVSKQRPIAVP
jgi:hypothetical protein